MMFTSIKYLCGITLAISMAGCYKDEGNYDYNEINKIAITSDSADVVVSQQDTLRINVNLSQTMPDASGLNYQWVMYPTGTAQTRRTLSESKNLSAFITEAPGSYVLDYFVTDKKTGVSFQKRFWINVVSAFGEGWMVLEEVNGATDIGLVTKGNKIYRNIYSATNKGMKLPAGANRIQIINYRSDQEIYIFAPNDMIQVNYIDFLKIKRFDEFFFTAPEPKPQAHHLLGGSDKILYNNGQVFAINTITPPPFFYGLPLIGENPYYMEPYPIYSVLKGKFFYDRISQRFYRAGPYDIELSSCPAYNPALDAFDMNNIGKKMLYAEHNVTDQHIALFKNNNHDSLFIYVLDAGIDNAAIGKYDVTKVPGLLGADHYMMSKTLTYLYYSNGNKVYKLDILAQTSTLLYTFPAGAQVADMKLYLNYDDFEDPDNYRVIGIATNEGDQGKLYYFHIAGTGNFTGNTYREMFSGFGKLSSILFKSRS